MTDPTDAEPAGPTIAHRRRDDFYDWYELWSDGEIWLSHGRDRWHFGTAVFGQDGCATRIDWNKLGVAEPQYRRDRWESWTWPGRTRSSGQRDADATRS